MRKKTSEEFYTPGIEAIKAKIDEKTTKDPIEEVQFYEAHIRFLQEVEELKMAWLEYITRPSKQTMREFLREADDCGAYILSMRYAAKKENLV